jgi:hypothetical protein
MKTVALKITGYGQDPKLATILKEIALWLQITYQATPLLLEGGAEELFEGEDHKVKEMTYYIEEDL